MNRKTKEIYKSVLFPIGVLLSALLIWEVASIASGKAEGSPVATMRAVMVLLPCRFCLRSYSLLCRQKSIP